MGADQELDPTTYAVRAVANTGATPYYAAIVGFSAFRGRRLQFGRSEPVQRPIEDIWQRARRGGPGPASARRRGRFCHSVRGKRMVEWDASNHATYLLCALALENAIKAFLVYEHPK